MGRFRAAALSGPGFAVATCAVLVLLAAVPEVAARAETASELDTLSRATDKPSTGIDLARRQIEEDELLEAMATLERVLMNDPENLEARALHAGLLCRVDDRRGAIMEFDALRGLDVPQPVSDEARQPCRGGG